MNAYLATQHALGQGLLQLSDQAIGLQNLLRVLPGQQSVQQSTVKRRALLRCHTYSLVLSRQRMAHTEFLTPSCSNAHFMIR